MREKFIVCAGSWIDPLRGFAVVFLAATKPQFEDWKTLMIKKALGIAALAAVVFAVGPADAAKMRTGGCSGPNQEKVETMIESMADGPNRIMGQQEIALAQADMLNGRMAGCAFHLNRAMYDATTPGLPKKSMQPVLPPGPTTPLKPVG